MAAIGALANTRAGRQLRMATIARRAGVGRTTAREALRVTWVLGLIAIEHRLRRRQLSLPNVLRMVSST